MRVRILSDLHLEFGEIQIPNVACDLVILAGDISTKGHGVQWALRQFKDVPVLYILGNHEYYGENLPGLVDKLRVQTSGTNVRILENEHFDLGGFSFFGSTLWTDMELNGDWRDGAIEAGSSMNDYKRIRNSALGYHRLSPRDTRLRHLVAREAMKAFFAGRDPSRAVVVTHHAPSPHSLPANRRGDLISCAYASRMEPFIQTHQPRLWFHGHIHHSNDYLIGATRIVANPHGYRDAPNEEFDPNMVVNL